MLDSFVLQVRVGDRVGNRTLQAAVLTIVNSGARAFRVSLAVRHDDHRWMVPRGCLVRGDRTARRTSGRDASYLSTRRSVSGGAGCVRHRTPSSACDRRGLERRRRGRRSNAPDRARLVRSGRDRCWRNRRLRSVRVPALDERLRRPARDFAGRSRGEHWINEAAAGPDDVAFVPLAWWLVGLGHLGRQGPLVDLGMLGYQSPAEVRILLQDDDRVPPLPTRAPDSCSPVDRVRLLIGASKDSRARPCAGTPWLQHDDHGTPTWCRRRSCCGTTNRGSR